MGIFDRIAGTVETRNPDAVYAAELERLDGRITEVKATAASLRARHQQLEQNSAPHAAEVGAAAEQALQTLAQLKQARDDLNDERVRAPAEQALAEAQVAMAEANSTLGSTAEARGLNSIRDHVAALNEAASPGELDADGIPIHGRRAALGRVSAEQSARDQLAAMKAALGKDSD